MLATSRLGYRVLVARLHEPSCVARAAVSNLHVPSVWAIIEALSSPCTSQSALTFEGSAMRADVCCSLAVRAGRSPVTSLAHGACVACCAGPPERVAPGTRSERSANRTCGEQHVMPHTRAGMGTRAFQIHTTFLLAVLVPVSYHTRDVSAPAAVDWTSSRWAEGT